MRSRRSKKQRIHMGRHLKFARPVYLPIPALRNHFHVVGLSGMGKSTGLKTLLIQLFNSDEDGCHFIFDPLGVIVEQLLLYFAASKRYCPGYVRCPDYLLDRLLLLEIANPDHVAPFNALHYDSPDELDYCKDMAIEVILRGWESQDTRAMARLTNWLSFFFKFLARNNLTLAEAPHVLYHGSKYHGDLVRLFTDEERMKYELVCKNNSFSQNILDSTRNRLNPFMDYAILRRLTGSTAHNLDIEQLIKDRRIVLVNLAPQGRLSWHLTAAVGGLLIQQIMAAARNLGGRHAVNLTIDEFHNFVGGKDFVAGLAELRNLNVRLILSHQNFDQLEQGDTNLKELIWNCRSRLMFGVGGEDVELLAKQMARYDYDPRRSKLVYRTRQQFKEGERLRELRSGSRSEGDVDGTGVSDGENWGHVDAHGSMSGTGTADGTGASRSMPIGFNDYSTLSRTEFEHSSRQSHRSTSDTASDSRGGSRTTSTHHAHSSSQSSGWHQVFTDIIKDQYSVHRETYTPQEWLALKESMIAAEQLGTGKAFLQIKDHSLLYPIHVKQLYPDLTLEAVERYAPRLLEAYHRLIEDNFRQPIFKDPHVIDAEITARQEGLRHRSLPSQFLEHTTAPAVPILKAPHEEQVPMRNDEDPFPSDSNE